MGLIRHLHPDAYCRTLDYGEYCAFVPRDEPYCQIEMAYNHVQGALVAPSEVMPLLVDRQRRLKPFDIETYHDCRLVVSDICDALMELGSQRIEYIDVGSFIGDTVIRAALLKRARIFQWM